MLVLLVMSFLVALCCSVVLIAAGKGRARLYGQDMVQRFHAGHVPRFGGLAMAAGCAGAWCLGAGSGWLGLNLNVGLQWRDVALWALVLLPVAGRGIRSTRPVKLNQSKPHGLIARQTLCVLLQEVPDPGKPTQIGRASCRKEC